jgi:hypothetical protein
MLTRCTFLLLCLWVSIALHAQNFGYKMIAKPSKKEINNFWEKYNILPDTLSLDQYEIVTEQIMVGGPSMVLIVPPIFKEITEQVLLKEAYKGYRKPVYKTQEEKIVVHDAYKILRHIPAVYDTIQEKVLSQASSLVLVKNKQFKGKIQAKCYDSSKNMDTCLWKLAEKPAVYTTIQKAVLKQHDSLEVVQVEAQYAIINKMTVDKEATAKNALQSKEINIPAEYRSIHKKVLLVDSMPREVEGLWHFSTTETKKLVRSGIYFAPCDMSPFVVPK